MKPLLLKLIAVACLTFLVLTLITFGLKKYYFNPEYPMWQSKIDYTNHIHSADNLIVGDSRAMAGIDPAVLGDGYFNLSLGGSTPVEGYYFLKRYLNKKKINHLILSYSPMHLQNSMEFKHRTLKFGFLTNAELFEIYTESNRHKQLISSKNTNGKADIARNYLLYLAISHNFFYLYRADIRNFSLSNPYDRIYKEVNDRAGVMDFGLEAFSQGRNKETEDEDFRVNPLIQAYLEKILILAREKHIRVHYVNMPFNDASFDHTTHRFKDSYARCMASLEAGYPEVDWHGGLSARGNDWFGDESHLNAKGRNRFSLELKNRLKN